VPTTSCGPYNMAGVNSIAAGPDGALWFVEGYCNKIGKVTTSGVFTEYPLPVPDSAPLFIIAGPDGAMWFTESMGNSLSRITTDGTITRFGSGNGSNPRDLTVDHDGNIWFTKFYPDSNGTSYINKYTMGGGITDYPLPRISNDSFANPQGITAGPDGAIWFTEYGDNQVGRISASGEITRYPLPGTNGGPSTITTGPDGKLWFTEFGTGYITDLRAISSITTSGEITQYPLTEQDMSAGYGIITGPDNNIWISRPINAISRFIPGNMPTPPTGLTANSTSGNVSLHWNTEANATSYSIYRNGSPYASSATTSYSDTSVSPGTTYSYYVTSLNSGFESGPSNTVSVSTTVANTTPSITSAASATAVFGSAFNFTVTTSGTPAPSLSVSGSLPTGVSFVNNSNGTATISGTPSGNASGNYPLTITAQNSGGSVTQAFTLSVNKAPTITSRSLSLAIRGTPFNFQVTATGYPTPTYSLTGNLPTGVQFNTATGSFSGTPQRSNSVGLYRLTVTATNAAGSVSKPFNLILL
jgi:streptogramin lyase